MKKILSIIFSLALCLGIEAKVVERVEPASWWSGMNDTTLQLMLHGKDIASYRVAVQSPLKITKIVKPTNPNYLFVYLNVKDVKSGVYNISLVKKRKVETIKYLFNERKQGSASRESFSSADAVYLIMPDRFANGNPANDAVDGYLQGADTTNIHQRQGGDLRGIIDHLDYIADLGMTAIWTTPIMEDNDLHYSYHHYAQTNVYKVDPRLGTNEEFVELVEKCHQKGLKYIMDIVPNHVNSRYWWQDDLPDAAWYNRQNQPFERTNYLLTVATNPYASYADKYRLQNGWFDTNMADVNLHNREFFVYLLQSYIYWIELTGLDGLRVDTYPYNDLNVASELMAAIRKEYPKMNIVAECWVKSVPEMAYYQSGTLNRDGFDSNIPTVMDFILKDYLEQVFVEDEAWNSGLIRFYNHFAQDFAFANPQYIMCFVNNHDMSRYSNAVNRDPQLYKMGLAMISLVRGFPQYFYGDEIMIEGRGGSYEDARHRFPQNAFAPQTMTSQQADIFNYLRKLLNFRKSSQALTQGQMKMFLPYDNMLTFFRYYDNEVVMVVINNSSETKNLALNRFEEMSILGKTGVDVITDESVQLNDNISVEGKSIKIIDIKL